MPYLKLIPFVNLLPEGDAPRWNRTNNPVIKSHSRWFFAIFRNCPSITFTREIVHFACSPFSDNFTKIMPNRITKTVSPLLCSSKNPFLRSIT